MCCNSSMNPNFTASVNITCFNYSFQNSYLGQHSTGWIILFWSMYKILLLAYSYIPIFNNNKKENYLMSCNTITVPDISQGNLLIDENPPVISHFFINFWLCSSFSSNSYFHPIHLVPGHFCAEKYWHSREKKDPSSWWVEFSLKVVSWSRCT